MIRLALLLLLAACDPNTVRCQRARVSDAAGTERFSVCVDVADTAEARRVGLSDRLIRPDQGLVLEWPQEVEACITNEPVAYAIDAVYAAASGEVVAVERDLPASDPGVRCHEGVSRVLEVRAGVAARVVAGDRLAITAE